MIRRLLRLFRLPLALMNGIAALGGYLLFPAQMFAFDAFSVFCGVTMLAMGGSALNQAFEMDIDTLMFRTKMRPLPQGEMSPSLAVFAGISIILSGCTLLVVAGGIIPAAIGFVALAWYLFIYTPLKRKSSVALLLGALSGSVPPLIGWCIAGGNPSDFRIIILSGLFFIWQIPHFWLLQQNWKEDYIRAGVLMFNEYPNQLSTSFFMFAWVAALIVGSLMLPVLNVIDHRFSIYFPIVTMMLILPILFNNSRMRQGCYNVFPIMLTLVFALQRFYP